VHAVKRIKYIKKRIREVGGIGGKAAKADQKVVTKRENVAIEENRERL